jgi:hypothetical protein
MDSRLYKALVALFSAGLLFGIGMWFGLVVVSPPRGPSQIAEVPVGTTASVSSPDRRHEHKKPVDRDADRKLTPIYPASPGSPQPPAKADNRDNATSESAKTAKTDPVSEAGPVTEPGRAAPPLRAETTGAASPERHVSAASESSAARPADEDVKQTPALKSASEPKTRLAALSTSGRADRCDVRACAAAYKSFRQSDCTYQPYTGPRQLCVNPGVTARRHDDELAGYRARAQAPRRSRNAELEGAVRAVERLTAGRRRAPAAEPWHRGDRGYVSEPVYFGPDDDVGD